MYCSIQEAWPGFYSDAAVTRNVEAFAQDTPADDIKYECNYVLKHMESCQSCRERLGQRSFFDELILRGSDHETLVMFTIGLFVVLLMNGLHRS